MEINNRKKQLLVFTTAGLSFVTSVLLPLQRIFMRAPGEKKYCVARGLTFLEIVIALSIFAVAFLGLLEIINTGLDAVYRAQHEIIAANLARGLLAEVMSKRFEEKGAIDSFGLELGEAAADKTTFDDVDDYDTWNEAIVQNQAGSVMNGAGGLPDFSLYSRSVAVDCLDGAMLEAACPQEYKRVAVTVSGPLINDVTITGVKVNLPE